MRKEAEHEFLISAENLKLSAECRILRDLFFRLHFMKMFVSRRWTY